MRTRGRIAAPARDIDEEECSWSASDRIARRAQRRRRRASRRRRRERPGRCLRRAGRRVHADAAASAAASAGGPVGQRPSGSVAPSASAAAAGPNCGTDPVDAERLLRDRLRPAVQAVRGVHQAVPERDLGHQAGPVHEPDERDAAPAVGRQPARPDPAAVDGRRWSRTGCSRTSTTTRRPSAGTSGPPAQLAQNRVADGRHPRLRLALRDGPQLQPDRRLLQQEARRSRSG